MRTKHRVPAALTAILALVVGSLWASSPASGVAGFGDVAEGRFYTKAVQWMVDNDITTGTSPTCFSPEDPVTRGQAAAFMFRMEDPVLVLGPARFWHPFEDVSKDWQEVPVHWMYVTGITTGTTPTTYSPEDVLTRGQMAALLWRLEGEPAAPPHPFIDVFKDWQQGPVSWMADTGITTGTTPTTFSPDDTVTRGQLATFFYRYKGEPPVVVDPTHPTSPQCAQQVPGPPPPNPGDAKDCNDFGSQAEAQAWFNTYFPHYGDVANLDADNDLVACEDFFDGAGGGGGTTTTTTVADCHPAYSPCLPNLAGDALNCSDLSASQKPVTVLVIGVDPYNLDGNNDGIGCTS